MNTFEINMFYSLAIIAVVISDLLLIGLGMYIYRKYCESPQQDRVQDPPRQEWNHDLKAMTVSFSTVSERLARLDYRIDRLQGRGQQGMISKEGTLKAFEVASKLAVEGAEVEELIHICGLTRGEAELMHVMQKARTQAPACA